MTIIYAHCNDCWRCFEVTKLPATCPVCDGPLEENDGPRPDPSELAAVENN